MATIDEQLQHQLLQGFSETKGPNIDIEGQKKVEKVKTPLSYEEMKKILESGGKIPKDSLALKPGVQFRIPAGKDEIIREYQNLNS